MKSGTADIEAMQKATMLRLRRAYLRKTGCRLDPDMVALLGQSFLYEAMEIAAGNLSAAEQD